jgi:hypothetical protein
MKILQPLAILCAICFDQIMYGALMFITIQVAPETERNHVIPEISQMQHVR